MCTRVRWRCSAFFHRPRKGIPDRWLLSVFRLPSLHASTGHPQWFFVCATAGRGRASAYRRRQPSWGSNTFHGTLIEPTVRHYQQEENEKKISYNEKHPTTTLLNLTTRHRYFWGGRFLQKNLFCFV